MDKRYCSIDLEFTGFDPEKEQILEIGFAFFELEKTGLRVTETWSQVFKPTIEVHPKILGLTGITQEEIDSAPEISEYRDFLTQKLADAVLVAHNPTLDVKFLEMAGIKLSGQVIDSLELVQFILPTHHSYNLENLMHYFGIEHKDSHRALGDSLSTISLIEKLLQIYAKFPKSLKIELQSLLTRVEFTWTKLLDINLEVETEIKSKDSLKEEITDVVSINDFSKQIILDPHTQNHEQRIAESLAKQDGQFLIAMSSKQEVLRLWEAGLVEGIFESEDLFNEQSFREFMSGAQTSEEIRFCLKVLVWLNTNWQTKTILDMNLSFFGGQFKIYIAGGINHTQNAKSLACDFKTLQNLTGEEVKQNRTLIICDLTRFEKYLTNDSKEKISWGTFNFVLKSIYNPELETGRSEFTTVVSEALAATDLFFGIVQILLSRYSKNQDYIELSKLESIQSVYFKRLTQAAENLSEKLSRLAETSEHSGLQRLSNELEQFFVVDPFQVKWVELAEDNVYLHSQPIEIAGLAQQIYSQFDQVKLTDYVSHPAVLFYLIERLGLHTEIAENHNDFIKVDFEVTKTDLTVSENLLSEINSIPAPAVVIFPSSGSIKSFYKNYFQELKKSFHLFAQEYSGSGNKIFRNFRIFRNSLLLATCFFVNKQKYRVPAQTILYTSWPQVDPEHPYFKALQKNYELKFKNVYDLLALSQIMLNLKQLSNQHLPHIVVSTDFAKKWNEFV